jgi:hypothetical protein
MAFTSSDPNDWCFDNLETIPGVKIRVIGSDQYQIGGIVAAYPFRGTCDIKLLVYDHTVDSNVCHTDFSVVRHYTEIQVLCETEELKAEWSTRLAGAVRTCVLSWNESYTWYQWPPPACVCATHDDTRMVYALNYRLFCRQRDEHKVTHATL